MAEVYTRRRAIAIFAAAAGLPLLTQAEATERPFVWKGQALGAPAMLVLNHRDRSEAQRLLSRVVAELARLEAIFSLYRSDSTLSELNRAGALAAPPREMVALLEASRRAWEATDGAFDPTVQPLWALYRDHFAKLDPDPAGPPKQEIAHALSHVGFAGVRYDRDRIALAPKMAVTLNGVAQGYITDRIVDILRNAGVTSSLVDMGEDRAIGANADGKPWAIGLAQQEDSDRPDAVLQIVDKAVATSSAAGLSFDPAGRLGHIIDPRSGHAPILYARVSVVADEAATADAFSTAFTLMEEEAIRDVVQTRQNIAVDLLMTDGRRVLYG